MYLTEMLLTFFLFLQLPIFSEHYKILPEKDEFSQSLEFQLLQEYENENDDGKSNSSSLFSECGISEYEPPMTIANIKKDSFKVKTKNDVNP
jgi:hypothetical protein